MPNAFSKQETVLFDDMCEGFEEALVMSGLVDIFTTDQVVMERSNDIIWRPYEYGVSSYDGADQTLNFKQSTQLSVPATISFRKSVPLQMSDTELRDPQQMERLMSRAKDRLASDINLSVLQNVCFTGSLCVKSTGAMSGFAEVASIDALMNEQGVPRSDRHLALSSRDYNNGAANLQVASRDLGNDISSRALREAFLGRVSSFDTYKLDHAFRKAAAVGVNYTIDTQTTSANLYTPVATRVATTGESSNVDNRTQLVTFAAGTGAVAGDRFTIAGCEAINHESRLSSGTLKQFVIIRMVSATVAEISPPIIDKASTAEAAKNYANVEFSSRSATAAVVFLNTTLAPLNPFWVKGSIELLPGRIAAPSDAGAAVMRATVKPGLEVVMIKWYDAKTGQLLFRVDTRYGVCNKNPEMNGVILFGQA